MTPADIASLRTALGRPTSPAKAFRRLYLEKLWETHDFLEREIIREERRFTDRELDRMLER